MEKNNIIELLKSDNYEDRVLACQIMIRTLSKGEASKIIKHLTEIQRNWHYDDNHGGKYHIIKKKGSWAINMTGGYPHIDSHISTLFYIKMWESEDEIILIEL